MRSVAVMAPVLLTIMVAGARWSEATPLTVHVGNSASDLNEDGDPARLQATWPRDAPATWSLDAAVTVAGLVTDRLFFGPTMEYHRNTQIDSPQDALRAGATSVLTLGDIARGAAAHLQTAAAYQREGARDPASHGVFVTLLTTPLVNKLAIDRRVGSDEWKVRWRPQFGVEYDGGSAAGQAFMGTLRGNASLHLDLFPAFTSLRRKLQITLRFEGWLDLAESRVDDSLQRRSILTASATLYADDGNRFGVGLRYLNGENPRDKLLKQEFLTAAIVLKLGDPIP